MVSVLYAAEEENGLGAGIADGAYLGRK